MNTRETESDQEVVNVAGVPASPAIERVATIMRVVPGLWTSGTYIAFSHAGGVEVSMHGAFEDVTAMAQLLDADVVPYRLTCLGEDCRDDSTVVARFWNGADKLDGGTEILWFANVHSAFDALGPHMSVLLLHEAELTSH